MKLLLFLGCDIHAATALKLLTPIFKNHQTKIVLSAQSKSIAASFPTELIEMIKAETSGAEKTFEDLARNLKTEILSYPNVNAQDTLQEFRGFAPDLIISIRFKQIFRHDLISIPKLGVINLHSGILPKYRGVMATFWAILQGEKKIGTSLHYITNNQIDVGDIIDFSFEDINLNSSLLRNINNLYQAGCKNISRFLERIENGEQVQIQSQDELGQSGYFSYPDQDKVRDFVRIMKLF